MLKNKKQTSPTYIIFLLILAGEAVFVLPFVLPRIFRATFLEVFVINNTQLGSCFSVYGLVALCSYLFGGPLADRFHPSKLMAVSLLLTASGGFYLASYPSIMNFHILYGFWGFTTIFLFWAAMIKATRLWGGENRQGIAFGFLDGGRGLVAALFGSLGIFIFSLFITSNSPETTFIERKIAFQQVIIIFSITVTIIGILVFFFLKTPEHKTYNPPKLNNNLTIRNFKKIIEFRAVWLLMIIILCAYFGYKMTDIFSLYAKEVMLYDEITSAKVGTYLLYMRPLGVVIGLLADRTKASLWIVLGFSLMLITSIIFASGIINTQSILLFTLSIGVMALGVYSVRVLYFATLEETKIPLVLTGTAVGFISLVGYTPDIFAGPLIGYFLDGSPGEKGHQNAYMVMAIFSAIGLIAAIFLLNNKKEHQDN